MTDSTKTNLTPNHPENRPQAHSGLQKITAYKQGKSAAPDGVTLRKLSSNESALGASPMAVQAFADFAQSLPIYPDGSAAELRAAIAQIYGLDAQNLVIGSGSDELLQLIAKSYINAGDEGLYSQYGFLVYPIAIMGAGGTPVTAPETDYTCNVDALLAAATEKTKVVFLANPNNPTGSYLPDGEIKRLHAGLPENVLLVLDGAYAEYVDVADYNVGVDLVEQNQNVVMTRTFSKIGLANLRCGWLYGPDHIVETLNKLRGPFNVNGAALSAAKAAVTDVAFTEKLRQHNEKWRTWTFDALTNLGLKVLPSYGNFLTFFMPDEPGKSVAEVEKFLTSHGVIVRDLNAYGMPTAVRVSIGPGPDMEYFIARLTDFIKSND